MKKCFKCGKEKPLGEFYKHPAMADGHLGKCKKCARKDTKARLLVLLDDPEWHEQEKARHREKYHRLGYKDKHKPSKESKRIAMLKYREKYPEKYRAKNKSQRIAKSDNNNHLHHWCYHDKFAQDVIELTPEDHALLHRAITYDQRLLMYRDSSGELLNTKKKHIEFMNYVLENQYDNA